MSHRALAGVLLPLFMLVLVLPAADAQILVMPDSTNNRMVVFDPYDGSVRDPAYFPLAGGTPVHAMQVGSEIWVSEQVGDRVSRWDFFGTYLGEIGATGGLDNIRGMGLINDVVYVTNAGTGNGAPGPAVVMFDTAGNSLGHFSTAGMAPSPFGILDHQGGMLVSSSSANNDIHRFALDGTSLGMFHNSTLSFVEQLDHATNGDVLGAIFTSDLIARFDPDTGALLGSFAADNARGVYQLGNGNVLWTSGAGAFVYDPGSGVSTQVYAGGGRYVDYVLIPEPAALLLLGAGLVLALRRR